MPRRPHIDTSTALLVRIPESVYTKLSLHLFSPLEGRVPYGKYREFIIERVNEYFDWKRLDLAPFGFPAGYFIAGPEDMISKVKEKLSES